jgi:protocatechuate 3,4-dioxygenase beta subunit
MNTTVQQLLKQKSLTKVLASVWVLMLLATIAQAQITGTVYRDFNANAQKGTNDIGVAGVTVTAYNSAGAAVGSATTAANGNYSIAPTGAGPFRLEFTNLPAGMYSGPFGTASGTAVQFAAANPSANNNLGINDPDFYCQDNPKVSTPIFTNGDPLGGGTSGATPTLFTYNYTASGIGGVGVSTTAANNAQLGAVWGQAYQKTTNTLYSSAVLKRHAGYGPLGIGGIYKTINANTGTPTTSNWLNVSTIGINVGIDPHIGLPASSSDANTDPNAYALVGKTGIGDIDMSEDQTKMYLTNLFDKKLYIINNVNPNTTPTAADVTSFTIPNGGCSNGQFVPWGIKSYNGKIYVGVVCTAETSQNSADLKATVYEFDGTTFTSVLTLPLNFTRGNANSCGGNNANWNPWQSGTTFNQVCGAYPQPILSDIEFDVNGAMILGFSDRFGNQVGYENTEPDGSGSITGFSEGDILRAGANANGTWTIENNASVTNFGTTSTATAGVNNAEGLGNGEFYSGDERFDHDQSTQGGLALLPGSNEVISTIIDPINNIYTGGITKFDNTTGLSDPSTSLQLYDGSSIEFFGKANGIGDIEVMCSPAPIEIGNRVWNDTDGDGIQDAGEAGIAGVTVQLFQNGTLVGTQTTTATGNYIFTGLKPNTNYEIRIATGGANSTPLSGLGLSTADAGTNDNIDSDGTISGANIIKALTTGGYGENNHTYDFGFNNIRFDLALRKTVASAPSPIVIGSQVTFKIEVFNQGNVTATNTQVTDYIPAGFTFTAANNPAWAASGTNATTTIASIAAGASQSVNLILTVNANAGTSLRNTAEISNDSGNDTDSSPDSDPNNDGTVVDDEINNGGGDQDDSDIADITITPLVNLGNQVFVDNNNNGTKDGADAGIAGATVNLYLDANNDNVADGAAIATTTTNANGLYLFANLVPGNYIVGVSTPTGFINSTGAGQESDPDTNTDNNDNGVNTVGNEIRSNAITLAAGTEPTGENPTNNPAGIADANSNLTVDFGFFQSASIGDKVFNDLNGDGIQDAGEPGIAGVVVKLLDGAGNPVLDGSGNPVTTTTDANGNYNFNVLPGTYIVEFVKPAGFDPTNPNAGTDPTKDSNASITTGRTTPITVGSGETNNTIDAGFTKPLNLGNQVFIDNNNNGVKDATDSPIAGATVKLYLDANNDNVPDGAAVATTTTDANGLYIFTGLIAGNYIVGVSDPAGFVNSTGAGQETDPDTNTDNNDNGVRTAAGETFSNAITLAKGTEPTGENPTNNPAGTADNNSNLTLDFGYYKPASLGDKVFRDDNQDGIQDPSEAGIAGVTVKLLDAAGNPVLNAAGTPITATTDANGNYVFSNLAPGTYVVEFVKPAGFTPSTQGAGTDGTKDSDANITTGRSNPVTLVSGDAKTDVDAGFYQPLSLGNQVWLDADNDGVKDATEAGIPALTVKLYADANNDGIADGAAINSTTTDANGLYLFNNLKPGSYIVGVTNPVGSNSSTGAGQETNANLNVDNNDNGISTVAGETRSGTVALTAGAEPTGETPNNNPATTPDNNSNLTVDFGFFQPAALGNFVFNDTNKNGIQDTGEAGVQGVTVNLLDAGGNVVGTTTTNSLGAYSFTNLAPGTYIVEFVSPNGFTFSPANQGTDDATDSDANTSSGRSTPVTLVSGQNDTTIDAGIFPTSNAGLGNFVFIDSNKDGRQDPGETGVSGVTVTLFDINNNPVATTITDATGFYAFNNLTPGTYSVGFTLPIGYQFTGKDSGTDDTKDSDADTQSGRTGTYTLTSGQFNPTVDAGIFLTPPPDNASIGNFVWFDTNSNGIQDAGEVGAQGVTVDLLDATGNVIASTVTDALGEYIFNGLAPGTYSVKFSNLPATYSFSPANSGTDDTKDSDANTVTGTTQQVTIVTGEYNQTLDAGINKPNTALASLGDKVFNDENGNGIQDAGEPGVEGVSVTLYDGAGNPVGSTVTDVNGFYLFPNLAPGAYSVGFNNLPQGFVFTTKDSGTDDAADSDADPNTGRTPVVTLAAGQNYRDLDAGIKSNTPLAGLGNFVWNDINANGIQEATETGVAGVTVTLFNSAGTPISTTITDQNGAYTFVNLQPGTYSVGFTTLPAGSIFTKQDVLTGGGSDGLDSDVNPATGKTISYTLVGGQYNPTIDAGIFVPGSIGNFVWEDRDGDGIQDPGEPGIAGVIVTLYDANGNVVATTTTGANGQYVFDGLPAGTYSVGFTAPAGYTGTLPGQGSNPNGDSDAGSNGRTQPIVLGQGQVRTDIDAGFVKFAKLGDKVFIDSNANGVQDGTEVGLAGVTVTLYNATTNAPLGTKVTDATGNYLFDELTPGSYYVTFSKPTGYSISPKDAGTNDALDSDADITTGKTGNYTLTSGSSNLTVDMGVYLPASLGDKVFNDTDKDGIQDAGEPGIPGIPVKLLDINGVVIATATTDANGNYLFTNLLPGKPYVVEFGKPAGFDYSPQQIGTDITKDSDVNPATGQSGQIILTSGENNTSIDAGLFNATPTPVSLIDLTVKALDRHVYIDWSTASEINNDRFEVERVKNLTDMPELLERVNGNGTTNSRHSYRSIDYQPYTGESYYRVVQYDYDGKKEILKGNWIKVILEDMTKALTLKVYPNPSNTVFNVILKGDAGTATIAMYDAQGKVVYASETDLERGVEVRTQIDVRQFQAGNYTLKVVQGENEQIQRLVITK